MHKPQLKKDILCQCNLCNGKIEEFEQTKEKIWASSDGRVLRANISLCICSVCGHVQKNVDDAYQTIIENIYKNYKVNQFDGSLDQISFQNDGFSSSRSSVLIRKIKQKNILKDTGKLLDFGCATGLFLTEFSKEFPMWDLYGQEYDKLFKDIVLKIDRVKSFYTKDNEITTRMDCISMNHALEHVPFPVETLRSHHRLLEDSGIHFVQVPSYLKDPFELCMLDHISHFSHATLDYLARKCGYCVISTTDGWTQKHIGWLATKSSHIYSEKIEETKTAIDIEKNKINKILAWLDALPNFILNYCKDKKLGILGTTPTSSWVAESINNENAFFCDEDPFRHGAELMGKIISSPKNCPVNACIFLPFAPKQAKIIQERLQKEYPHIDFFYFNKELS